MIWSFFEDVGGDRERVAAVLLDEFDGLLGTVAVDVNDGDLGALRRKSCDASRPSPDPAPVMKRPCRQACWSFADCSLDSRVPAGHFRPNHLMRVQQKPGYYANGCY